MFKLSIVAVVVAQHTIIILEQKGKPLVINKRRAVTIPT